MQLCTQKYITSRQRGCICTPLTSPKSATVLRLFSIVSCNCKVSHWKVVKQACVTQYKGRFVTVSWRRSWMLFAMSINWIWSSHVMGHSTVLAVSVKFAIAGPVHHSYSLIYTHAGWVWGCRNSYRRKENQVACSNSKIVVHGTGYEIWNSLLKCSAISSQKMSILEQFRGELCQIYKALHLWQCFSTPACNCCKTTIVSYTEYLSSVSPDTYHQQEVTNSKILRSRIV